MGGTMKSVIIDPEKCIGCKHCYLACAVEHSREKELLSAIAQNPVPRARIFVDMTPGQKSFPNRCRHCEPAPCLDACPSGAIFRDEKTQSVLIDETRCINCAMCAMACPFGVIRFYPETYMPFHTTIALKCDNCVERQRGEKIPACVAACKTGALTFNEINEALRQRHLVAIRQEKPPREVQAWRTVNAAMEL